MTNYLRRDVLKTAGAFALTSGALNARNAFAAGGAEATAYVGTYTAGADNHGEGIYRFRVNLETGELTNRKLAVKTPNPTWLVIAPSKKFLYAINEGTDFALNNALSNNETANASFPKRKARSHKPLLAKLHFNL